MSRWLFSIVYRKWLWNDWYKAHDRVVRVLGWRTAIVEAGSPPKYGGQRKIMTPCFWWFD